MVRRMLACARTVASDSGGRKPGDGNPSHANRRRKSWRISLHTELAHDDPRNVRSLGIDARQLSGTHLGWCSMYVDVLCS